ncbi:O-antigen ligase family protein [Candidatus Pelagibacter sp.]|nr:O-antigen ligase family protein [Candidatus Pelagibacter sp.]
MKSIIYLKYIKLFLLYVLPISIILGQSEFNLIIFFTAFVFLLDLFLKNEKNNFYKDEIFLCFLSFSLFIFFYSIFLSDANVKQLSKSIAILISAVFIYALGNSFKSLDKRDMLYLLLFYFFINIFIYLDLIFQFWNPNFKDIFGFQVDTLRSYNIFGNERYLPLRLSGPFNEELVPGFYLSTFGSIAIFLTYFKTTLRQKNILLLYFLLFINFFFVIFTGERSSSIISFLILVIFIFYFEKNILKNIFYLLILILSVILIIKLNPATGERVKDIFFWLSEENGGFGGFFSTQWGKHYLISFEIFKDHIFIGSGIRSFREICPSYEIELSIVNGCTTHPHNYLLEILSETGLLGAFIFLIIFYFICKKNLSSERNTLSIALLIVLFSYLFPLRPTGAIFSSWHGGFLYILIGFNLFFLKNKNHA